MKYLSYKMYTSENQGCKWRGRNGSPAFHNFVVFGQKSEENVFLGVFWCWICTDEDITPPCFTSLGYWKVKLPCFIGRVTPLQKIYKETMTNMLIVCL